MQQRKLGSSGLTTAPLVLGGNVFGWTIDAPTSFDVLDAFVDHGFNAIDTADVYSAWVPGNKGGESETIIGKWLKARPGMREKVTLFTKVGSQMGPADAVPPHKGLSARWITTAVEDSLKRLGIETIDLYFSHWPDPDTPYEETLRAYEGLLQAGKVRAIGASNLDADQLGESLRVAKAHGLPSYQVLQPGYNLYDRTPFEGALADLCQSEGIGVVVYYALASGFLSGKYRSEADLDKSKRGGGVKKYLTPRGLRILDALDAVASAHGASSAEIALAWLMAQPAVTAPIASATSTAQIASFARAAALTLTADQLAALGDASRPE
ncbi:aldo/keto reductase [Ketogulonicigenium robustum]|nr:aldo/keto reductase [Ketogulonicigenium robustum]